MPRWVYLPLNTPAFSGHTTGLADLPHPALTQTLAAQQYADLCRLSSAAQPRSKMRTVSQPFGGFSVGGLSSKRNSHPLIQHVCVPAPSLHGRYPLLRCRVGGGALARWPPSAAQTARTVFPYAAFTKTPPTETQTKGNNRVNPRRARQVDPGHQYPQTMMYGFFAKYSIS